MPAHRYEFELSALHEMLTSTVSNLLTDSQAIVKQTLIESGITKLCVFFGRQKGMQSGIGGPHIEKTVAISVRCPSRHRLSR